VAHIGRNTHYASWRKLPVSDNLRFVGTVNVDETTHFWLFTCFRPWRCGGGPEGKSLVFQGWVRGRDGVLGIAIGRRGGRLIAKRWT
jgi:hypothetical protein